MFTAATADTAPKATMTVSVFSAARSMCAARDWNVTNLELQKLLYIAHMTALGRSEGARPLVLANFEAWDYGPVLPDVYHRAKAFGDRPVPDVFRIAAFAHGADREIIDEVAERFAGTSPASLVAITHWENGAWAQSYVPGAKRVVIPNRAIVEEYRQRTR